jgi:hypothetical protein
VQEVASTARRGRIHRLAMGTRLPCLGERCAASTCLCLLARVGRSAIGFAVDGRGFRGCHEEHHPSTDLAVRVPERDRL